MNKNREKKPRSYFGAGFVQASFERPQAQTKASKSILIVTEGRNTEPLYFKSLAAHWSLHPHVTTIEPGCEGIPKNLVDKALAIQKQRAKDHRDNVLAFNQVAKFEETWIVFDTEHASRQGRLEDGIQHAQANGMKIAHSNPCFEFWLALHYGLKAKPMNTCKEACKLLNTMAKLHKKPYSKENGATVDFMNGLICRVPVAVRNSRLLSSQQSGDVFPANPSVSVHDLVISMHQALPDQLQKRFPLH